MNRDSWVALIDALLHWSTRKGPELPPTQEQPKKVGWELYPFDFNRVAAEDVPVKTKKVVKRKAAKRA